MVRIVNLAVSEYRVALDVLPGMKDLADGCTWPPQVGRGAAIGQPRVAKLPVAQTWRRSAPASVSAVFA